MQGQERIQEGGREGREGERKASESQAGSGGGSGAEAQRRWSQNRGGEPCAHHFPQILTRVRQGRPGEADGYCPRRTD